MARGDAYAAVLDPANELLDARYLTRPSAGLPLWQLAGVSRRNGVESVSGATGFSRGEALVRGAGEVVERYPVACVAATHWQFGDAESIQPAPPPENADVSIQRWQEAGVCPPAHTPNELIWMAAEPLCRGATTAVPVACAVAEHREARGCFDEHPSGWASGLSVQAAARRAWNETIERDAFFAGWAGLTPIYALDARVAHGWLLDRLQRGNQRYAPTCAEAGIRVGVMPASDGRWVGIVIRNDERRARVSIGLGCNEDLRAAVVCAGREAWQVSAFLEATQRRSNAHCQPPGSEGAKARYLCSEDAVAAATAYVASWEHLPVPVAGREEEDELHAGLLDPRLVLDQTDAVAIDMTGALPRPIQALGWHVVRVVSSHAFQFRADERLTYTWSTARLSDFFDAEPSADWATGLPPHPLP